MISNSEYLSFVNFAANRSYNDPTQYPVFPWVVTDYKNSTFPQEKFFSSSDQRVSRGWRDMSKPIGALSSEKLERFRSKYFQLVSMQPSSSPFLQNMANGTDLGNFASSAAQPEDIQDHSIG